MAKCYYCNEYLGDMRYNQNKLNQSIVRFIRGKIKRRRVFAHIKCRIDVQKKELKEKGKSVWLV